MSKGKAEVKVLVAHAGLHGSFIPGDKPIIDLETARSLAKVNYVKVLKITEEPEKAVDEEAEAPEDVGEEKEVATDQQVTEKR